MRELVEDLLAQSRQHALLRLLIVLSLLVFTVALLAAGETSVWALVALSVLGVACAVNPHGGLPAAVMVYVVVVWAVGVRLTWAPWTFVAAMSLLVFHTACALAAALPAQAPVPRGLWVRYAVRLGLVASLTAVVWLLALAQQALSVPGGVAAGVAGLTVLAVGLAAHHRRVTRAEG